jgi:oxygen-independent coproporphyrinogen-3 oxidase
VLAEFDARAGGYSGTLASIYFGGGTPSLWAPACIAEVIAHVTRRFGAPREVTLEANPTDLTGGALDAWHAAGIDRLSIGVQSFVPDELVMLGRQTPARQH